MPRVRPFVSRDRPTTRLSFGTRCLFGMGSPRNRLTSPPVANVDTTMRAKRARHAARRPLRSPQRHVSAPLVAEGRAAADGVVDTNVNECQSWLPAFGQSTV